MPQLLDMVSWGLLLAGSFLSISGALGLLRFPDFFTRMHAASVTDTLSTLLIIAGLALQVSPSLVTVKLLLILAFAWFTGPVSAHALAKAALRHGIKPKLAHDLRQEQT